MVYGQYNSGWKVSGTDYSLGTKGYPFLLTDFLMKSKKKNE